MAERVAFAKACGREGVWLIQGTGKSLGRGGAEHEG